MLFCILDISSSCIHYTLIQKFTVQKRFVFLSCVTCHKTLDRPAASWSLVREVKAVRLFVLSSNSLPTISHCLSLHSKVNWRNIFHVLRKTRAVSPKIRHPALGVWWILLLSLLLNTLYSLYIYTNSLCSILNCLFRRTKAFKWLPTPLP
jgi:hypothetical protein